MSKIEYVTRSWNPIIGCSRNCSYCYARKILKRFNHGCKLCASFTPHYHPERLAAPLTWKKPQRIFWGSLTDLFAPEIQLEWLEQSLKVIKATPQHRYIAMTKCRTYPKEFIGIENLWTGQTIEGGEIPNPMEHKILNIEPLLNPVRRYGQIRKYKWVIVGVQTNPKVDVPEQETEALIDMCKYYHVPIFVKDNVRGGYLQEYPEGLKLRGEK